MVCVLICGQVEPSKSEQALDGLKQVMSVKSRVVLPYLIPQVSLVSVLSPVFSGDMYYVNTPICCQTQSYNWAGIYVQYAISLVHSTEIP